MREEPICVASRIRCPSPPDRVAEARSSVRESSPPSGEGEPPEKRKRLLDREAGHRVDPPSPHRHRERLFLQARPPAAPAGTVVHVAGGLLPHPFRVGLPVPALEVADHPLERLGEERTALPLPP